MCMVRALTYGRASAGHGGNICSGQDHRQSIAAASLAPAYDISYMGNRGAPRKNLSLRWQTWAFASHMHSTGTLLRGLQFSYIRFISG